ncbi:LysM domain-containing protein [Streptomyces sp. SLBN-118]|uniref:LysM peptidoglycan-binding domain-containing protein n=1 Tax=Streptomyces sp. SLBN-118 TaxID=2768454 RepID=UPI00114EA95D|nr:transglycosylase family protein [Streptomyces sp. SLBN-118]TQK45026.1 LysM domain-containing protein [Streptomyces sp. SLBN-118]
MLSGHGRHRRPRQAPAIVLAAGVTGSAIAIPLLGAGSASAADSSTWDRVAECESGGMWSADLDNGYYGGLQMSEETWQAFGGAAYAPTADLASRSQQIAVAEKVLDAQGPAAWSSCAAIAGLQDDGTATGVDPGTAPSPAIKAPAPTAPEESTGPSAEPSAEPSAKPTSDVTKSATPAPEAPQGDGRHRGEAAPEETEPGSADSERETGRHASRGDGSAHEGTEGADESDKADSADAAPGEYTVVPGDSLSAIVDKEKLSGGWTALYEKNRETVGDNPDLIRPGQSLDLDLGQG